ncbi:MAG: sigma-70 family RNA polymerase sigma factor [Gemmataceae bacterium]
MDSTSHTLLQQAQAGSAGAWTQLDALYRPFLRGWLRAHGFAHAEADDLTQEVLLTVVRDLGGFAHPGKTGAFRGWLRSITLNRARTAWRTRQSRGGPIGGSEFQRAIDEWESPNSGLEERWDRDHDRHVLQHLLREAESTFGSTTLQAFRRLALDGASPEAVAAETGLTVAAVYLAKSRVLRRLRANAAELLGDEDALQRS